MIVILNVPSLFASEPVRLLEYSVLGVLIAALVAHGVLSSDVSGYLLATLAAVLGVPAVEVARAKVAPWPPPQRPVAGK